MSFVAALAKPAEENNELEFKALARDINTSFKRMRESEKLHRVYMRAYDIGEDMGEQVKIAAAGIERTAMRYQSGGISLEKAASEFALDIPPMIRFLIHEIQFHEGDVRVLSREVNQTLHNYYDKKTLQNAAEFLIACTNDRTLNTHWLFDNVARAATFCAKAAERSQELAA